MHARPDGVTTRPENCARRAVRQGPDAAQITTGAARRCRCAGVEPVVRAVRPATSLTIPGTTDKAEHPSRGGGADHRNARRGPSAGEEKGRGGHPEGPAGPGTKKAGAATRMGGRPGLPPETGSGQETEVT